MHQFEKSNFQKNAKENKIPGQRPLIRLPPEMRVYFAALTSNCYNSKNNWNFNIVEISLEV